MIYIKLLKHCIACNENEGRLSIVTITSNTTVISLHPTYTGHAGQRKESLLYFLLVCNTQCFSHVQLHDPMDCNQPGSSGHGIL